MPESKYEIVPPPEQPSAGQAMWEGFWHDMMKTLSGTRQLAARAPILPRITGDTPQAADQAAIARERAYRGPFAPGPNQPLTAARAHPTAAGLGEFAGSVASLAPLAALPGGQTGLMARVGMGALGGGLGAATQPVVSGRDYWSEKAKQVGIGAAAGGALGGASSIISPAMTPEAQSLAQQGVRLTPGQRVPFGTGQAAERTLQAFPIVRGYVQGQVGRSLEDFNRAAVRQSLEPIGAIVPGNIKAGHDLMKFATAQLERAYDQIKPQLALSHQGVANAIQNNHSLQQLISELPDDLQRRFTTILQNRVLGRFQAGGSIDGETFKQMESYLSRRASSFAGTNDSELGEALHQTLSVLRDELATQNPQFAPVLQRINQSYAMFTRLRDASSRRATSAGLFTPADLLASAKTLDPSVGHGNFSRGDALLQTLGEAGQKTLSGSFVNRTDRLRWNDMLMGAVATPPYMATSALQKIPGAGHILTGAAPAVGARTARQRPAKYDIEKPPEESPRVPVSGS